MNINDAQSLFTRWYEGNASSPATSLPASHSGAGIDRTLRIGITTGTVAVASLAVWRYARSSPSLKSCEKEVKDVAHAMENMSWPEADKLAGCLELFKAELDLFALRVDEANENVRRCKKSTGRLLDSAGNLLVKLHSKTQEVVMRWTEESLTAGVSRMQSILNNPGDRRTDYAGIARALSVCMADLAHADALRMHASWLPELLQKELAEAIMDRQAMVQEVFTAARDRFRIPLREELWDAVKGVREGTPPGEVQALERLIDKSEPLDLDDREILRDELMAHAAWRQR